MNEKQSITQLLIVSDRLDLPIKYSTSQNKPRQNIDGTWLEQVQSKCFSIFLIHFI